jgi:hypothetical protein
MLSLYGFPQSLKLATLTVFADFSLGTDVLTSLKATGDFATMSGLRKVPETRL